MDKEALRKIWEEMDPQDFDEFIDEYVGYQEEEVEVEGVRAKPPGCYGSGDHEPYCRSCAYKSDC